MVRIHGETVIGRPIEVVFDFVADERNEPRYNPRMVRAEKLTDGPIGAGTPFAATFLKGNQMTIEVVRFERPRMWESVGRSRRLEATTQGSVTATQDGARLTMRMELRPRHVPRLLLPLLARHMHRQQERNLAAIKAVLER